MSALSAASSRPFSVSTGAESKEPSISGPRQFATSTASFWCGLRCQRQDLLQADWSVGQETPDPPDEECDDEDHQKDITNLDDTIANKADDTESVKVDDKINDGDLDSAADKDKVNDDKNDNEWAPGTEVYTTMQCHYIYCHLVNQMQ